MRLDIDIDGFNSPISEEDIPVEFTHEEKTDMLVKDFKVNETFYDLKSKDLKKINNEGYKRAINSYLKENTIPSFYNNENPLSYEEEDKITDPEIESEIEVLSQKSWEEILDTYPDFEERLGDMKEELKELYDERDFDVLWSYLEGCGTLTHPEGYENIDYDDVW